MQKIKKPKFTTQDLGNNPFLQSLTIPVMELSFKDTYVKDEDVWLQASKIVDTTHSCRLFTSSELRKFTNNLSLRSKELLLWIMYDINYSEDFLWLNKKRYMEEVGITAINTYKAAVKELVRYGYLGLTVVPDVFWINPLFFFKGDRVKAFPKNLEKI